jgi:LmbE family N-acetylglucosaminyl deacetylase
MSISFPNDAIPVRRPQFQAKTGALYFLLSRRAHAALDNVEQAIWEAIDGSTPVADLRKRFAALDNSLERFVSLGVCEIPPAAFPPNRRRVLVIEPHMDDAALSVGGTMWLRRDECEFTVMTLAGVSNFTSYYMLGREFFDIAEVTALRKAESVLFLRHVGGRHVALDLLEAPLRYRQAQWTLDWFRQHREAVSAFLWRSAGPRELEEWTAALAAALAASEAQEIWMPLGVGKHVDHQLTRDACLRVLRTRPELLQGRKVRFYEDVPYTGVWPGHAGDLIRILRDAGARLEEERVDIGEAMPHKLRLLSIFGSQFKMAVMGPRVEKSARLTGAKSSEYGELLYELVAPPRVEVDPLSCYLESGRASGMARRLAPWLARHQSASLVRMFVPTSFGRWTEDMRFLLEIFPRARFEVYLSRPRLPETEALSSPRILIRPIESRRWSWYAAAGRLLLSRPSPLVIVASPGKEHHARWLGAACLGSDPVAAPSLNDFILGLRLASASKGHSDS